MQPLPQRLYLLRGFWFWLLGASLQDWLLLLVPTSHCLDPAHMLALLLPLV
jgi:hypothetical protein